MVGTACPPPDNLLSVLSEGFVQVQKNWAAMNGSFVTEIRMAMRNRLNKICDLSSDEKNQELEMFSEQARQIERDLANGLVSRYGNPRWIEFLILPVEWKGVLAKNAFLQKLLLLYEFRHGVEETNTIRQMISQTKNKNRFSFYVEYGESYEWTGVLIRRIWIWDNFSKKQKKEDVKKEGKKNYPIDPVW